MTRDELVRLHAVMESAGIPSPVDVLGLVNRARKRVDEILGLVPMVEEKPVIEPMRASNKVSKKRLPS